MDFKAVVKEKHTLKADALKELQARLHSMYPFQEAIAIACAMAIAQIEELSIGKWPPPYLEKKVAEIFEPVFFKYLFFEKVDDLLFEQAKNIRENLKDAELVEAILLERLHIKQEILIPFLDKERELMEKFFERL